MSQTNKNSPYIRSVRVDKLALTVDGGEENAEIEARIQAYPAFTPTRAKHKLYRHSGKLRLNEPTGEADEKAETEIFLQFGTTAEGRNNFRLEFNPGPLTKPQRKGVRRTLEQLFGDQARRLVTDSNITRLDIAVDVVGARVEDFLYAEGNHLVTAVFFHDGRPQTLYLGGHAVVYDKKAELEKRGVTIEEEALLRIETRSKNLACAVAELHGKIDTFLRGFERVAIHSVSDLMAAKLIPPVVIAACQYQGVNAALQGLSQSDREVFAPLIEHCRHEVLDPPTLAPLLESALKKVATALYLKKTASGDEARLTKRRAGKPHQRPARRRGKQADRDEMDAEIAYDE